MLRKGDIKTKDVYMHIKANLLGDVVISAGRFEQKLSDVTVSMDLLKAGDIAKQAPTDLSSTLNTMPGVDINDKQPSIRGGNGWTYGVGSRSLVLVDGMSALSSGNGVINWNIVRRLQAPEPMSGSTTIRLMTNTKGWISRTHDGSGTSMCREDSTCFPTMDTASRDTTGVCGSEAI